MPTPVLPVAPVITAAEANVAAAGSAGAPGGAALLQTYIDTAVTVVEDIVGAIQLRQVTQVFDGGHDYIALPWRLNLAYDTTITEYPNVITDYYFSSNGLILHGGILPIGRPFFAGLSNLTVSGWTGLDQTTDSLGNLTYPPNLKLAVLEQFRFMWNIGKVAPRAAYSQEGAYGEYTPSGFLVPHRVMELCKPSMTAQGYGFA